MTTLTQLTAFLVVIALSSSSVVQSPNPSEKTFELLILHNNDMHARFEQTSQLSGTCTPSEREAGKCYGGFPRVAHVVKEARKAAASGEGPPVLYLNAGDTYTGTAWFTIYKWKIAAEFINALQPDAVSLGNHELDDGVEGLTPFIKNLTSPVLAANLILDDVPELENEPNLHKSIILNTEGTKIGIIGYLTPDTKFLVRKNKVKYEDEVAAIKREVENLKRENVSIFIALGHSGYEKDIQIAENVDDIDLVIGGHSHTFLGNPIQGEPEVPEGSYPTVVTQPTGRQVLVVQAYAYTKYLGKLHLTFDSNGEIIHHKGIPLLLYHEIPNDPDLLHSADEYKIEIERISEKDNEVIGQSLVPLNGYCRLSECNMGNLITDAIKEYASSNANISIVHGGSIRISIEHSETPIQITRGDLSTALPFPDTLTVVTLNGNILKKVLEHSVSQWSKATPSGRFLQMAGMNVTYDLAQPIGSRVIKVQAICWLCGESESTDIKDDYEYRIAMPAFLANGGDNYTMFENLAQEALSHKLIDTTLDYLSKHDPVKPEISNRIIVLNQEKIVNEARRDSGKANNSGGLVVSFTLQVITLGLLFLQT